MKIMIPILAFIASAPTVAVAQGAPGTNVTIAVQVASVAMRGDTTVVTYLVQNQAASAESLAQFMVIGSAVPLNVFAPQPDSMWYTDTEYGTHPVAWWASLGGFVAPGSTSDSLSFDARGLPGIVRYWAEGYYPLDSVIPADTVAMNDAFDDNGVSDSTVGVEILPSNLSAANLLDRLETLRSRSCGSLGWITDGTVCSNLQSTIAAADLELSQADTAGAEAELNNLLADLETERGTGLPSDDTAYWLLKSNATYILGRL